MKKHNFFPAVLLTALVANVSLASECDIQKGETTFAVCKTCHTAARDSHSFVGPNLFNVFDRKIASKDDFFYSPAMSEKEGVWDESNLNEFIKNPAGFIPGTMMAFGGIKNEEQRNNLICFLKSLK